MQRFNRDFAATRWCVSLACLLCFSGGLWADSPVNTSPHTNTLHIQPNTCVSLHQGQSCFADLTISWNTADSNNYCLYSSAQSTAIKCWIASKQGVISQQFSSAQTLHFYLQEDNSGTVVAEAVLKVSWVYKKQQKSRLTWRLF